MGGPVPRKLVVGLLSVGVFVALVSAQQPPPARFDGAFKSGVDLVSVSVTVVDSQGQFVHGLHADDFVVREDDVPQTIAQFTAGHVPVSLGIALDLSASMAGEKAQLAKQALDALLYDLFDPQNEFMLFGFNDHPTLLQDWTRDRNALMLAADRGIVAGRTSLLDVVAEALPRLRGGNRKTALIVVSDGNDNSSTIGIDEVRAAIRRSDALVYALGVNCGAPRTVVTRTRRHQAIPSPLPFRFPRCVDSVDAQALRDITDISGGRTEIVEEPRDLERAAKRMAAELTDQYYLGYSSTAAKDGRWHSIQVSTGNPSFQVRARRGYVAR